MDQITHEAKVAITLAALAYTSTGESGEVIKEGLNEALGHLDSPGPSEKLPTGHDWNIVWGPMVSLEQDMSFIVQFKETSTYAFVIRGTAQYIIDAIQNFELTLMAPEPDDKWFPENSQALVSEGAYYGVKKELCLSSQIKVDHNKTALQFLREVKQHKSLDKLLVTGHSQGGTDTTLAAVALHNELNTDPDAPTEVIPYGFAGLSAGNTEFATLYEKLFPEKTRFYNTYDLAWRPWQENTLSGMINAYEENGTYPGFLEKLILKHFEKKVRSSHFRQPETGFPLEGKLYDDASYNTQAGAQHNHIYYMKLMGIDVEEVFKVYRKGIFAEPWHPPKKPIVKPSRSIFQILKSLIKFLFGSNPRYKGEKPSCK